MGGAGNVLNNLLTLNIDARLLSIVSNEYIESLIKSKHLINIEDDSYLNIKKIRFFSQNYRPFFVYKIFNLDLSRIIYLFLLSYNFIDNLLFTFLRFI